MAERTTYLITGANRGIGQALVTHLVARPNTTVIATIRIAAPFTRLDSGPNSMVYIIPLDNTYPPASQPTYKTLFLALKHCGISSIDVVIANAGTHRDFLSVSDTSAEELQETFQINTIGPILLFQTLWPLLSQSRQPKFFVMSSVLGSINCQESAEEECLSYGISKCAVNFFVRRAHFEYEGSGLVSVALHPGWVQTEMGQSFADSLGLKEPPLSVEESVRGLLEQIDGATRADLGGKFVGHDGKIIPW